MENQKHTAPMGALAHSSSSSLKRSENERHLAIGNWTWPSLRRKPFESWKLLYLKTPFKQPP
ncbi:hypothetical protein DA802_21055, partial [Shouchella clausii]